MRKRVLRNQDDSLEEAASDFGLSVSDLMSALLLIFVLLLSVTLLKLNDTYKASIDAEKQARISEQKAKAASQKMYSIAQTYKNTQLALLTDLKASFAKDLKRWNARIYEDNRIRFVDSALFDQGQSEVKPQFKQILNEFFPRYIALLNQPKYRDVINEIRIEGHTSSEWVSGATRDQAYFSNMQLSQDRTRSVLQYALLLIRPAKTKEWARELITANGLSFSKTLLDANNSEDKAASRRVEFKVVTDSETQLRKILRVEQ